MNWRDLIESRQEVLSGKPVFKDTRIPVAQVLDQLGAGDGFETILKNYPRLRREHILAACSFAADYVAGEDVYESSSAAA